MKCPHCGKKVDIDPTSPEALLAHIEKQLSVMEKHRDRRIEAGCEKGRLVTKNRTIAKWKAWRDWVKMQMKPIVTNLGEISQ